MNDVVATSLARRYIDILNGRVESMGWERADAYRGLMELLRTGRLHRPYLLRNLGVERKEYLMRFLYK